MQNESLIEGGKLVALNSGSLAVEGVPGSHVGAVVHSAHAFKDGPEAKCGAYVLTRRVIAGTDLWHVRRLGGVPAHPKA